jgi:hypothetical protein
MSLLYDLKRAWYEAATGLDAGTPKIDMQRYCWAGNITNTTPLLDLERAFYIANLNPAISSTHIVDLRRAYWAQETGLSTDGGLDDLELAYYESAPTTGSDWTVTSSYSLDYDASMIHLPGVDLELDVTPPTYGGTDYGRILNVQLDVGYVLTDATAEAMAAQIVIAATMAGFTCSAVGATVTFTGIGIMTANGAAFSLVRL